MREIVRCSISTRFHFIKFFFTLIFLPAQAQLQYHGGIELPIYRNESTFNIVSLNSKGLIFLRPLNQPESTVQFIHVDTAFNQKWTGLLTITKKYVYARHFVIGNYAYFLFHHREFSDLGFQVYQIDLTTGNFTRYNVNNYIPFLPTHFKVTESGMLIGGYFTGKIPVVLFFNFNTTKSKVLPALFNEPGELLQIDSSDDQTFSILISSKNEQRQKTLWIKKYSSSGDLIQNNVLNPSENQSFLFGQLISLSDGTQLLAGTYGNRNSEFSKGLYITRFAKDADTTQYYPFSELQNFFSYLKTQRAARVKERIYRKTIKGKKIRLQYRFLVNEIISHQDEIVLLGEAFYPVYKNLDRNYLGGGLAPGGAIFDGYKYTHAVIIGFDKNGDLRWDNSFEITDVKSYTLEQFVKIDIQKNKIILFYLANNKIRYKFISDNQLVEQKEFDTLDLKPAIADDEEEGLSSLDYWYKNYFTTSGTKYTSQRRWGKQSRRVFFVTKLSHR